MRHGAIVVTLGVLALVAGACASPGAKALPVKVDAQSVDLGVVPFEQLGTQTFLLSNPGKAAVSLGAPSLRVEEGCDHLPTVTGPAQVGADEAGLVIVRFHGHAQPGPHRVVVEVPGSDPTVQPADAQAELQGGGAAGGAGYRPASCGRQAEHRHRQGAIRLADV